MTTVTVATAVGQTMEQQFVSVLLEKHLQLTTRHVKVGD